MNVVDIGQACDTLYILYLFNNISQKSNNETMVMPSFENIQLPFSKQIFPMSQGGVDI